MTGWIKNQQVEKDSLQTVSKISRDTFSVIEIHCDTILFCEHLLWQINFFLLISICIYVPFDKKPVQLFSFFYFTLKLKVFKILGGQMKEIISK